MQIINASVTKAWNLTSVLAGVFLLILLSPMLAGCKPNPGVSAKEKPATVEKIEGSELSRIVLSEKAMQRIELKTVAVRSEKVVRTQKVGGQVVTVKSMSATAASASSARINPASLRVKVSLSKGELSRVNRSQAAKVVALEQDDQEDADDVDAEGAEVEDADDDSDDVVLQYTVKGGQKLVVGQRVFVELPLSAAVQRSLVPASALVYDLKGDTWVYTSTALRTFMRHKVVVDYLDDETAVLWQGPPVGTLVVTDGVAQLYGTEFGVGK